MNATVEILVQRRPQFAAFVSRRVRDPELVDEILQDCWLKALEHLDQVRDPDAATAWFWRVVRNRTNDAFRSMGTTRRREASDALELDELPEAPRELEPTPCRCALKALDQLKLEYRDILREVEMGGLQVKEYARTHGLTASAAGVRAFRARGALRDALSRTCGECATSERCASCACG